MVPDSIAVYAIAQATGQLVLVEVEPTGGANLRNFGLDPTGTYLIVSNHSTNDIFTFHIDPDTGQLTPTDHKAEVGTPVCHKFIPVF